MDINSVKCGCTGGNGGVVNSVARRIVVVSLPAALGVELNEVVQLL
jgi:hypothetical protein